MFLGTSPCGLSVQVKQTPSLDFAFDCQYSHVVGTFFVLRSNLTYACIAIYLLNSCVRPTSIKMFTF